VKAGTIEHRRIPLDEARIKMLEDIEFSWSLRSSESVAENWQQRFDELCAYKSAFGHSNVPSRYEANRALAAWCGSQRSNYRQYMKAKDQGSDTSSFIITEDRVQRLESIGFEWSVRTPETTWKKRLEELRQFKVNYGADYAVPSKYKDNPRLGLFAKTQRAQRILFDEGRPSTLDQEKVADLDALGFCWHVSETAEDDVIDHHNLDEDILHAVNDAVDTVFQQPNSEEGMESHGINPHNGMYHPMVDIDEAHQIHVSNEETQQLQTDQIEITNEMVQDATHPQPPPAADYDITMSLIAMPNAEEPYNIAGGAGAISMAADIAAAVTVNQDAMNAGQQDDETMHHEHGNNGNYDDQGIFFSYKV